MSEAHLNFPIQLSGVEMDALQELVMVELQTRKSDELEEGYAPDLVEISLLLDLLVKVRGPRLAWEEIDPLEDDDAGGDPLLQSSL